MSRVRDFVDSYKLVRLIRAGHACQVWEAVDDRDGQRYALKLLQPEQRGSREELGYLKREFEVAHGFKHPNVIKVLEFKGTGPAPYLVLELYSAKNMKQELREGPQRIAYLASKIVEQAGEALYYVHTQGWVHCDVKPDNFLVNEDGFVKLIDFAISQKHLKGLSRLLFRRTKVQGTRSYMSPEQIRGGPLDPRADIYSLGCVLYELIGGKPPFTGESPTDLLNKHLRAAIPSLLVLNNNVTPDFASLVKRMMSKDPAQRPDSMWEFLKEFRTIHIFHTLPKPETKTDDDDPL